MILKSEGAKVKYVTTPARDKKYAIVGYSQLLVEHFQQIPEEARAQLVLALLELTMIQKTGF